MPTAPQRSFTKGEVSPAFHGSANLEMFHSGLATCRNMVVNNDGVSDRGGSVTIAEHKATTLGVDSSEPGCRLIPFRFNTEQTYILEFGDKWMRVHKNGSPVGFGQVSITSIAEGANTYSTFTKAGHGLVDGDEVRIRGIVGDRSIFNNRHFIVDAIDTDTFNLIDLGTNQLIYATGTTTSYGTFEKVVRVATPWPGAQLHMLRARQRGDVVRVFCKNFPIHEITRYSDTGWTIAEAVIGASIAAPGTVTISGGSSGNGYRWAATAVNSKGEESLLSGEVSSATNASSGAQITIRWDSVSDAIFYKVYKRVNAGGWGFIGTSPSLTTGTPSFTDYGYSPDYAQSPPIEYNPFYAQGIALSEVADSLSITSAVRCAEMHPSGLMLAVGCSAAPYLRMYYRAYVGAPWKLASGAYQSQHASGPYEVHFSPNGWIFTASTGQSELYVYHLINSGDTIGNAFSTGTLFPSLIVSSSDAPYQLVNYIVEPAAPFYTPVPYLSFPGETVKESCCFTADGFSLIVITVNGVGVTTVRLLQLGHCGPRLIRYGYEESVSHNFYIMVPTVLIAAGTDVHQRVVAARTKSLVAVLYLASGTTPAIALYYKTGTYTYAVISGQPADAPSGTSEISFSPNGQYLNVLDVPGTVDWYELTGSGSGTICTKLTPVTSTVGPLNQEWSFDGKFLIVSGHADPFIEAYRVNIASDGTKTLVPVADFAESITGLSTPADLAWDSTGDTLFICQSTGVNLVTLKASYAYPATGAYFQQRMCVASMMHDPISINASCVGSKYNFNRRAFPQDEDSFTYTPEGNEVNEVRHLETIGRELVALTMGRETSVGGTNDGPFVYGSTQTTTHSYHGAAWTEPVALEDSLIYVQDGGSILRDLRFRQDTKSFNGGDMTALAKHLFKGKTIARMGYQAVPHQIVWVVLNDGTLLGATYMRDQGVLAWHRHDTDGYFRDIACVREGRKDYLYALVDRECADGTRRFLERFPDTDVAIGDERWGAVYMDAAVVFDGRNTDVTNLFTITGKTGGDPTWTAGTFNVTFTTSGLLTGDVAAGSHIFILDGDNIVDLTIASVSSATAGTVTSTVSIPGAYQNVGTADWAKAVTSLAGMHHLVGKGVSIFADGAVVANPNDSTLAAVTVSSSGTATVTTPVAVAYVGIPYICDIETLDIEDANPTLVNNPKNIYQLSLRVKDTLGVYAGPADPGDTAPLTSLNPVDRNNLHGLGVSVAKTYKSLYTGVVRGIVTPSWSTSGHVFLRKVDPVPWTIVSISASFVMEGDRG